MAFVWRPGVWIDATSTWYPFPRPVDAFLTNFPQDMRRHKVPGGDGAIVTGFSQGMGTITIRGKVSQNGAGTMLETELAKITELELMRTRLQGDTANTFWLMEYYHAGSSTYRFWKDCRLASVSPNEARVDRYIPYVIEVHALDPTRWTTAEGNLT